uniref:Similar to PLDP1 (PHOSPHOLIPASE D ZETA1) n=1 Tax=Arundo donax TaxID=35708 RepID=A0A0A9D967_ARUDO
MRMLKFCATQIISQLAYTYGLTMKKLLSLTIKYAILEALICALVVMILLSIKLLIFLLQYGQERITTILGNLNQILGRTQ